MDDNMIELAEKHETEKKKFDKPYATEVIKSMGLKEEDLEKDDFESEEDDEFAKALKKLKKEIGQE